MKIRQLEHPERARACWKTNTLLFGAGGSIGAAVAKEFAAEGARVFLAGRTKASLEAVASQITSTGGEAQTTIVDALDDAGVNRYLDSVAKQVGKIDIIVLAIPLASSVAVILNTVASAQENYGPRASDTPRPCRRYTSTL